MMPTLVAEIRRAPAALRAVLPDTPSGSAGRLSGLLAEAVDHLDRVLATRAVETVAALAVPVAVHRGLSDAPVPEGLLASAAATYLAFDALDDQMDGDRPAFWSERRAGEVVIGAQILLLTAAETVVRGSPLGCADALRAGYQTMIAAVAEGQLGTEVPVSATVTPTEVATVVSARSGAMLAGFAALAALAAGAAPAVVSAAHRFGHELGVARQHVNDLTELVGERTTDLRNGTATMALALALQRLDEAGRAPLLERVQAAASDVGVREELLAQDLTPVVREVAVLVLLHLGQARSAAHFLHRTNMRNDDLDRLVEFTAASVRRSHAT